jgi:hypothetical protein
MSWEETTLHKQREHEHVQSIKELFVREMKGLGEIKILKEANKYLRTGYYYLLQKDKACTNFAFF